MSIPVPINTSPTITPDDKWHPSKQSKLIMLAVGVIILISLITGAMLIQLFGSETENPTTSNEPTVLKFGTDITETEAYVQSIETLDNQTFITIKLVNLLTNESNKYEIQDAQEILTLSIANTTSINVLNKYETEIGCILNQDDKGSFIITSLSLATFTNHKCPFVSEKDEILFFVLIKDDAIYQMDQIYLP